MAENQKDVFTRRMFIKGMATSFGALPVFAWPRWAQAFYYNLGFFKSGSAAASPYVEDVFSTYLYNGTDANLTITNGINLSLSGGMTWLKSRNIGDASNRNCIFDTARGARSILRTDGNAMADLFGSDQYVVNGSGFTLSGDTSNYGYNNNTSSQTSWTFRKASKFFDIITYTGNGTAPRTLPHSLGIAPGMVIIKRTSAAGNWWVYHRSSPNQGAAYTGIGGNLYLDTIDAADTGTNPALSAVSSSSITLSTNQNTVLNISGETYVVYLFAHDTSTDGLIQCGSVTADANGKFDVTLGWEAQWVMLKQTNSTSPWYIEDVMRGMNYTLGKYLQAESSQVEQNGVSGLWVPTSRGFSQVYSGWTANAQYVYVAIRGPMKKPTDATKVFSVSKASTYGAPSGNTSAVTEWTVTGIGFSPDFAIAKNTVIGGSGGLGGSYVYDRLRGNHNFFSTALTDSEGSSSDVSPNPGYMYFDKASGTMLLDGFFSGNSSTVGGDVVQYFFRRAPGFFDQVCYAGNGAASRTVSHSLGVTPELMMVKSRGTGNWYAWYAPDGTAILNSDAAGFAGDRSVFGAVPSASVFTCDNAAAFDINASGVNYTAYLFASCAGVSKIGSYTGSASDITVSCEFSGQPRFVLVKRIDSTGNWIVVDSARGTSVYLTLNTTIAETSAIVITFTTGGFIAKASTVANAASGANYIFMAIA